ncbi:hypothetical protein ACFSNO_19485 [Streptomyces cirratus]
MAGAGSVPLHQPYAHPAHLPHPPSVPPWQAPPAGSPGRGRRRTAIAVSAALAVFGAAGVTYALSGGHGGDKGGGGWVAGGTARGHRPGQAPAAGRDGSSASRKPSPSGAGARTRGATPSPPPATAAHPAP